MAISHAGHSHPNTTAARTACRKRLNAGQPPVSASAERILAEAAGIVKTATTPAKIGRVISTEDEARLAGGLVDGVHPRRAAKLTVVPRRRGDGGVVKGMKAAKPGIGREVVIKGSGDLPTDIPANHVLTIARAWERGWSVVLGERLRDDETRILIGGDLAQVSLVWNVEGSSGVFVRSLTSSISHRVDSGPQALALASGDDDWPWMNGSKRV